MRLMDRNKRPMWLSHFDERAELVDDEGYGTGEYVSAWTRPVKFRGNWAPPTGLASHAPFGTQVSYDVAVVLDDNRLGIREGDVIWLGGEPEDAASPIGGSLTWSEAGVTWTATAGGGFGSLSFQPGMSGSYEVRRVAYLWNAFALALKSRGGE